MLKKGLFAGGGLLLLLVLLFGGRTIWSYLATTSDKVVQSAKDMVPVEFELDRARKMIEGIEPEIAKHKRDIAREEIALSKLAERLEQDEEKLAEKWSVIERLRDDLARGESNYVYREVTYTAEQVERDLGGKFDRYTTSESTVEQNRKILEIRRKALSAAHDKLQALTAAKLKLEGEVENLEARLQMVEVAKATSELNIDDSQLSRTRELLADIEARIEVDAQLVNADEFVFGEIQLDDPAESATVLERIAEYQAKKDQSETYVDVKPEE
jgi:predicted  nucleic acid-binding Zn-ribbon protein